MRTALYLLAALSLLSCGDDDTGTDTDADTDADTDSDTDTDTDTDGGTDIDGDGWTIEGGDCDDTSVFVNPSVPEDLFDGVDNDCDGRIDESLAGVMPLYVHTLGEGNTSLFTINLFGDYLGAVDFGAATSGSWVVEHPDRDRWVTWTGAALYSFDQAGPIELLADLSEYEWPDDDGPRWLRDLGLDAMGDAFVTGEDRLVKVSGDTPEVVASWFCAEDDGHDLCATAMAIDPLSQQVMLFGLYGGIATWTEETGLVVVVQSNPEEPGPTLLDGEAKDSGGFFALGVANDGGPDVYGIYRFNDNSQQIELKADWPNDDFAPSSFVIDGDGGDLYVTANGAWSKTVWKIDRRFDQTNLLYDTGLIDEHYRFMGVTLLWD